MRHLIIHILSENNNNNIGLTISTYNVFFTVLHFSCTFRQAYFWPSTTRLTSISGTENFWTCPAPKKCGAYTLPGEILCAVLWGKGSVLCSKKLRIYKVGHCFDFRAAKIKAVHAPRWGGGRPAPILQGSSATAISVELKQCNIDPLRKYLKNGRKFSMRFSFCVCKCRVF